MLQITDTFSIFIPDTTFGIGGINGLSKKVKNLRCKKPLLVTDPGIIAAGLLEPVEKVLKNDQLEYGIFGDCQPDALFSVINALVDVVNKNKYDLLIAVGGGSVMDTTKLASVMITGKKAVTDYVGMDKVEVPGLTKIYIPTTAGTAAEWSHYANITDDHTPGKFAKLASGSVYYRPDAVIVDAGMTMNLPPRMTAVTGIDTLVHGCEPFTSWKSNPLSDMICGKCISLVAQNLRAAYTQGARNPQARYNMSIAASLGFGFTVSAGNNVHAMAYPLQMSTHITHGESVAIMLPAVMEYNLIADLPKYAQIAELMGEDVYDLPLREQAQRAVKAVRDLISDVGVPLRIRDVGGKKEDIAVWAETVFKNSPHLLNNNIRKSTKEDLIAIYEAAY